MLQSQYKKVYSQQVLWGRKQQLLEELGEDCSLCHRPTNLNVLHPDKGSFPIDKFCGTVHFRDVDKCAILCDKCLGRRGKIGNK